jgi:tyrosine-protein phosphatase YwqE|tara:strand:+ start:549 stop:1301 length:753 start_codon:yes stop_codon:yes gene_type:complete
MGLFNRIFSKKELTIEPINLSFLRNDIHSHLIPGIDDGSPDMETTIILLKKFIDLGYKKVITTPHIMSDYYKNTPEIILSGLDKVNEEIIKNNLDIEIEAAAEYNLEPEFEDLIEKDKLLTFGTENYLLFELSFFDEPTRLNEIIWKMREKGLSPVLAHVERYGYWHKDYDKIEEMINRGVKLQVNIGSIIGAYGPEVKKVAEKLIEDKVINFVGSDCHHEQHLEMINHASRLPIFHSLIQQEQILNKSL